MMKEEITDEEVKKVYANSISMPVEKIIYDLQNGKLPYADPIILSNGYGVGMSLDCLTDRKGTNREIKHIYVINKNGNIDPAIADILALRILGDGYIFIDIISTNKVYHYMKEDVNKMKD